MSINHSLIYSSELCDKLNITKVTRNTIIKLFRLLRTKIKESFHLQWERRPLALEPL